MSEQVKSNTAPERRTSIRTKLLFGLAVPVLFVALISGFQVNKSQQNLNRTQREVDLALAAGGPTTYITALLDERNITGLELLGLAKTIPLARVKSVAQARKVTDLAQKEFAKSLAGGSAEVRRLFGATFTDATSRLSAVRHESDAVPQSQRTLTDEKANTVFEEYTTLIGRFHTANANAVRQIDDAELRNRAGSIAAQTRSSDLLSRLSRSAALSGIQKTGIDQQLETEDRFKEFEAAKVDAISGLDGDPAAQKTMRGFYERPVTKRFENEIRSFVRTTKVDPTQVISDASSPIRPNGTDAWKAARASLLERGDTLIDAARTSRNSYVALFIVASVISLVLALLIARSIARPLMSIASQAEEMATNRLPAAVGSILATPIGQDVVEPRLDPITVSSRDEVAHVADSINVVQQRALDLAVEQAAQRRNFADTFLNLGRRVQGLVTRQLDFITELEEGEQDPEVLADLFKLDHLATRIRRNAESLVVLAGVTRRQRRGEPVEIIDALRSALGEVDEYPRVDIGRVDDARLPMSIAADVAHILAELIENGLNFSPPETFVEVTGESISDGYRIVVRDHGLGMTEEQITTANRRLSGNESFTVAPSRYMGHFVAGHLATGLGIDVHLEVANPGTLATVLIPSTLLAVRAAAPAPEPTTATHEPQAQNSQAQNSQAQNSQAQNSQAQNSQAQNSQAQNSQAQNSQAQSSQARPVSFAPAEPVRAESLKSLLSVHRRLSQSDTPGEADRSPWATRDDATSDGDANDE